jgi:DNA-binding HxlR family transcriptional regulator
MSLSELEKSITGISQKMLLQHLKELKNFGIVDKKSYEGYPLRVEYFLTEDRGRDILKAIEIMQDIGIQIMLENGMSDVLDEKGIAYDKCIKDTH